MELNLPAEILEAVSAPGGGRITLIIGAGCSLEAPTSIPLARRCSKECHDRLVADGVLAEGDCQDPSNLSLLADTLFAKLGTQAALVRHLKDYGLKTASPNEGHKLTAALLREGPIGSVLTLNFDLALSTAIGDIGDGGVIGIIDRPEDLRQPNRFNLYYIHRNANEADLDLWILRTEVLETAWKDTWQAVVTAKVLATPVVVFAGLGSPADVLIESSKRIRSAIPNGSLTYQIDPGEAGKSAFFKALELDVACFVKGTWVEFMHALSQRLVSAQAALLESSARDMAAREQIEPEDLTLLLARLPQLGLLELGQMRANCLLYRHSYAADEETNRELIADLFLAIALIARVTGATATILGTGIVGFRRQDRVVSTYLFVSGCGSHGQIAIQGELSRRRRRFQSLPTPPSGVIAAGLRDIAGPPTSPPVDVVLGNNQESIIFGQTALPIFNVASLRRDTALCKTIAP